MGWLHLLVDNGVVTDFETQKLESWTVRNTNLNWFGWRNCYACKNMKKVKETYSHVLQKSNKRLTYFLNHLMVNQQTCSSWSPLQKEQMTLTWRPAELSKYLMKPGFADKLRQASTPDQKWSQPRCRAEAAAEEAKKAESVKEARLIWQMPLIVAILACTAVARPLTWRKKPSSKRWKKWVLPVN